MPLSPSERRLVDSVPPREELTAELRTLVDENSFTDHKVGVDRVGDRIETHLEALGFRVAVMVTGSRGRHLIARHPGTQPGTTSRRLLLIGHHDTVHPPESPFRAFALDELNADRATGPGVADMKGGLVVMLGALQALAAADRLDGRDIVAVIAADEEAGSPDSGELLRAEAGESQLALAFECGHHAPDGASTIVTARRGVGRFTLHATGGAGHAGMAGAQPANAVLELAHQAVALAALADEARGRSVTIGAFHGGTAANVVPADAKLTVDFRFPDAEAGDELEEALVEEASTNKLVSRDGRGLVRVMVRDRLIRPPLVRNEGVAAAAARVIEAGADLGLALVEEARGGSSDAALAAAEGCPAVCGMGIVGGDIHSPREWADLTSLRERAAVAALVIDRFFEG